MMTIEPNFNGDVIFHQKILVHLEHIPDEPEMPICAEWRSQLFGGPDQQIVGSFSQMNQYLLRRHLMFASTGQAQSLSIGANIRFDSLPSGIIQAYQLLRSSFT